jgi:hypothetical protein
VFNFLHFLYQFTHAINSKADVNIRASGKDRTPSASVRKALNSGKTPRLARKSIHAIKITTVAALTSVSRSMVAKRKKKRRCKVINAHALRDWNWEKI